MDRMEIDASGKAKFHHVAHRKHYGGRWHVSVSKCFPVSISECSSHLSAKGTANLFALESHCVCVNDNHSRQLPVVCIVIVHFSPTVYPVSPTSITPLMRASQHAKSAIWIRPLISIAFVCTQIEYVRHLVYELVLRTCHNIVFLYDDRKNVACEYQSVQP